MEFSVLTTTLTNFVSAFSGGYARVQPIANGVLSSLLGIEIVLGGLWLSLSGGDQLAAVFKKILYLGFWVWLTTSFPTVCKEFCDSLVRAGLIAGGQGGNVGILLDPSRIASLGLDATEPLAQALGDIGITNLGDAIVFGISYLFIMAAFCVIAIQVFLAVLEFYLITVLATVLVPFGVSQHTKFLAEKAIGAVVGVSIKMMVLAFILAVAEPTLRACRFSASEIKFNELWAMMLTCGALAYLAWSAPGLAAGLLAGSPSLAAAGAAQSVTGATSLAAGAIGATRAAASSAGSVARSVGARTLQAAGLLATSARMGAAAAPRGAAATAAGALVGMARAAGVAGGRAVGTRLATVRDDLAARFNKGAEAALPPPPSPEVSALGSVGGGLPAPPWAETARGAIGRKR